MANNTTSFQEDSSSSGANEDHRLWLNDEDFTTVMIVTVSGMLVLGIFLILCLVRFPSYDTIENLLHDKRSFRHEWSPDSSGVRSLNFMQPRPPIKTPFLPTLTKSGTVREIKLPKDDQFPQTHLPPMMPQDSMVESIENVESILEADDEAEDSIDKAIDHVQPPEVVIDVSSLQLSSSSFDARWIDGKCNFRK